MRFGIVSRSQTFCFAARLSWQQVPCHCFGLWERGDQHGQGRRSSSCDALGDGSSRPAEVGGPCRAFVQRNCWEFRELGGRVEAPAGTKAAPRPWVGGLAAPLIARIIQYLGAGRPSDSPGRRRGKRAQLNWRTRTKRELVPFWNSWASLLPDLDPGNAVLSDPGRIHGVALVTRAWPSPVTRRRRERDALV